ncbi:MEDS domain-containing protein [Alicyclobacillus fastidiosus]|uniref:MEDS domain-containing protein n=1 Tax=Alicyclobacillus fastidiosus TaxID=392011 RepID=UPI0034DD3C33
MEIFTLSDVLEHLQHVVQPYVDSGQSIRLWGHVDWRGQADIAQQLQSYECSCDMTVGDFGVVTVCAYNGRTVPAYVMSEMMCSHPLLMTDDQRLLYRDRPRDIRYYPNGAHAIVGRVVGEKDDSPF